MMIKLVSSLPQKKQFSASSYSLKSKPANLNQF